MPKANVGDIVHYTLTKEDVARIMKRRVDAEISRAGTKETGFQVHFGNKVLEGDVYPLVVTRVWDGGLVNGQVLLDGTDIFWVTSVGKGESRGTWAWPFSADEDVATPPPVPPRPARMGQ